MSDLIAKLLDGNRRALARLISIVERGGADGDEVIHAIYPHTGNAHLIGITGPPGAGKSTLVNGLAKAFRAANLTVAILAVDPTSPFTGGALLGDRIRMTDLYGDKGVFIRSMASRGQLGGLARASADAVKLLDAAGFDKILIETVGAGQAEVDIAMTAHTTLVIEAPGMGDDIQSIKAGILEIADILVVNKADRPEARNTVRALRNMLQLGGHSQDLHHGKLLETVPAATIDFERWEPPIVETVATGEDGIALLVHEIGRHQHYLLTSGNWTVREAQRSWREVEQRVVLMVLRGISAETRRSLTDAVLNRQLTPAAAAKMVLEKEVAK
jgi:LAO/AO transport system kinase